MNKIRIGFDYDRVFVNYPPFIPSAIIEMLYKRRGGNLSYRIPGKIEQKIRILSHYHLLRPVISKNITAMQQIVKNKNVETYVISSRFSFLREKTHEWNKKNNMQNYFKEMFFNFQDEQPHVFKERIIRQAKINKFIDDDLDLLSYLAKRNPNVEFYWINNNGALQKLSDNIKHIKNLEEFFDKYV